MRWDCPSAGYFGGPVHQRLGELGHADERPAGDLHGLQETRLRAVDHAALQVRHRRERDRVQEEIEAAPGLGDLREESLESPRGADRRHQQVGLKLWASRRVPWPCRRQLIARSARAATALPQPRQHGRDSLRARYDGRSRERRSHADDLHRRAARRSGRRARVEQILRTCVHCGFCTATCPTYVLLGDELDSPRGRIYLIKDMLESGEPAGGRRRSSISTAACPASPA